MHPLRTLNATLATLIGLGTAMPLSAQSAQTEATTASAALAPQNNTDESGPHVMGTFVVTGSNIPTAADALAVPVVSLNFTEIQSSGVETSTLDILRKMVPSISGIGSENANIASATNYGGAQMFIH